MIYMIFILGFRLPATTPTMRARRVGRVASRSGKAGGEETMNTQSAFGGKSGNHFRRPIFTFYVNSGWTEVY